MPYGEDIGQGFADIGEIIGKGIRERRIEETEAEKEAYKRRQEETPTAMMKQFVKEHYNAVEQYGADSPQALESKRKINILAPMIKEMQLTIQDYQQVYEDQALEATKSSKVTSLPWESINTENLPKPPEKPFFAGAPELVRKAGGLVSEDIRNAKSDYASKLKEWSNETEQILRNAIKEQDPNIDEVGIGQYIRQVMKQYLESQEDPEYKFKAVSYFNQTGKIPVRGGKTTVTGRVPRRRVPAKINYKPTGAEIERFMAKYPQASKKEAIEAIMKAKKEKD